MAHIWFMHGAHLGCALFFLDMLAQYTLRSMTVMATACLWYVVGMRLVCPMSKFPELEEDKRATTNVQNGLVFFFLFSFIIFSYL